MEVGLKEIARLNAVHGKVGGLTIPALDSGALSGNSVLTKTIVSSSLSLSLSLAPSSLSLSHYHLEVTVVVGWVLNTSD